VRSHPRQSCWVKEEGEGNQADQGEGRQADQGESRQEEEASENSKPKRPKLSPMPTAYSKKLFGSCFQVYSEDHFETAKVRESRPEQINSLSTPSSSSPSRSSSVTLSGSSISSPIPFIVGPTSSPVIRPSTPIAPSSSSHASQS